MKIFDKIFAYVFAAMSVGALIAGITGARHQFVMAGLCAFLALMMWPDGREKEFERL